MSGGPPPRADEREAEIDPAAVLLSDATHRPRRAQLKVAQRPPESALDGVYLVVDADPDRPGELPVFLDPSRAVRLHPIAEEHDTGLPWMSPLEQYHLAWLEAQTDAHPGVVLVRSALPPEALADALADRTLGVDSDGREVFIRWYDPAILGPLLGTFSEPELRWWFEPVLAYGVALDGGTEWFDPPDGTPCAAIIDAPPFRLTAAHFEAFDDRESGALEGEIRAFIEEEHPETFADLPEDAAGRLIQSGITRAEQYGLEEVADLAAFVAIMVDVSLRFDEQPKINAILRARDIPPEDKLPTAIAECSDEAWDEAERYDDG